MPVGYLYTVLSVILLMTGDVPSNTVILTVTAFPTFWNHMVNIESSICPLFATHRADIILRLFYLPFPVVLVRVILNARQLLLNYQILILTSLFPSLSPFSLCHDTPLSVCAKNAQTPILVGFLTNFEA